MAKIYASGAHGAQTLYLQDYSEIEFSVDASKDFIYIFVQCFIYAQCFMRNIFFFFHNTVSEISDTIMMLQRTFEILRAPTLIILARFM